MNTDHHQRGTMTNMPTISPNGMVSIITADTPLRLEDAIKYAFPAGGMTVSGLRKEIERGRLAAYKIANKQFTTLADIQEMKIKCRVPAKDHTSGSELPVARTASSSRVRSGSSKMQDDKLRLDALLMQADRSRQRKRSGR
jgi:hypothetical protein